MAETIVIQINIEIVERIEKAENTEIYEHF